MSHSRDTITFKDVMDKAKNYIKDENELNNIKKAYELADTKHEGQFRKSGEPYIVHPLNVALILTTIYADSETLQAALLHDVLEDCDCSKEEMTAIVGPTVTKLVEGVTKISRLHFSTENEYLIEYYKKIIVGMSEDVRVIIVKLADRLHNMRTLWALPEVKQKKIAKEALEILAPIGDHLGIHKIKSELEDLSLRYLKPDVFYDIAEKLNKTKIEREHTVGEMMQSVGDLLTEHNINYEMMGRAKSIYSIYRKLNKGKRFSEIYDLSALRILVETKQECYLALGIIHSKYRPMPKRFKDYIAMPKANMYQSLHTTLIGPNGQPFEIQIRTFEMHKTAEYGIAAHWKYKESSDGKLPVDKREEEKLNWLRQILEWQKDMSDNREFMSLLKNDLDLFADSVYCFTPQGDVKTLPNGSTPIDFAYCVHSAVGNRMVGARVNGKLVPIEYRIKNGDRIEIITSMNSQGPSRDWLKLVKSTQAKNKINQWFKKELKEDNILKGKEMLTQYAKSKGYKISMYTKTQFLESVMRKYGFRDWDSVLAAIGHGGLKEGQVFNKLLEAYEKENQKNLTDEQVLEAAGEQQEKLHVTKNKGGIIVKGIHDVAVRFSKCCSPIPGDEIVGFVTRGRGITIHRTDCVNVLNMSEADRSRLIEAEWQPAENKGSEKYMADLQVFANNRTGLLVDISKVFTERKIDMRTINSRTNKQEKATISITFEIGSKEELASLIEKIRQIESVLDVERGTAG